MVQKTSGWIDIVTLPECLHAMERILCVYTPDIVISTWLWNWLIHAKLVLFPHTASFPSSSIPISQLPCPVFFLNFASPYTFLFPPPTQFESHPKKSDKNFPNVRCTEIFENFNRN